MFSNILTYTDYCEFIQFDGRGAQELLKSGSELFSEAKMLIDRYTVIVSFFAPQLQVLMNTTK